MSPDTDTSPVSGRDGGPARPCARSQGRGCARPASEGRLDESPSRLDGMRPKATDPIVATTASKAASQPRSAVATALTAMVLASRPWASFGSISANRSASPARLFRTSSPETSATTLHTRTTVTRPASANRAVIPSRSPSIASRSRWRVLWRLPVPPCSQTITNLKEMWALCRCRQSFQGPARALSSRVFKATFRCCVIAENFAPIVPVFRQHRELALKPRNELRPQKSASP